MKITKEEFRRACKELVIIIEALEDEVRLLIPTDKVAFYKKKYG